MEILLASALGCGGSTTPDVPPAGNPAPVIASLVSDTAFASDTGFTLVVNGSGFIGQSRVLLDGQPLATTRMSPTQVAGAVTAGLLVRVGSPSVAVENPAPGGGTSNTLTAQLSAGDVATQATASINVVNPVTGFASTDQAFPILSTSTVVSQIRVPIVNSDVVYDSTRSLLYVSVPAGSPRYADSVVALDPATGQVQWGTPVGDDPGLMAISDDDSELYVALKGEPAVVRVAPGSRAVDLRIDLGYRDEYPVYAGSLVPIAGQPRQVALVPHSGCCGAMGADLYVDSVAQVSHAGGVSAITASSSASVLYGFNNASSGYDLARIGVGPQGLSTEVSLTGVVTLPGAMAYSGGRLYFTSGQIVDAATLTRVAGFSFSDDVMYPDALHGRVFFQVSHTIQVRHYTGFDVMGSLFMNGAPTGRVLVRWGPDGLVLAGGSELSILRSPMIGP